ncbi:MAG: hypothetical protein WC791_00120 [Candidatus Paceibacterota bacterium]|jgi:hypothetical protein
MSKRYILVVVTAVVGITIAAFVGFGDSTSERPIACTMEAKICPDGITAVGRTGPNCEFAVCPAVSQAPTPDNGQVVLGLGETGKVGDMTIKVNSVVSDSRCPADVQCIWAGELKVNITLATASKSETKDMTVGKEAFVFEGHTVTITDAPAVPNSSVKVGRDYYRIGFNVVVNQSGAISL